MKHATLKCVREQKETEKLGFNTMIDPEHFEMKEKNILFSWELACLKCDPSDGQSIL